MDLVFTIGCFFILLYPLSLIIIFERDGTGVLGAPFIYLFFLISLILFIGSVIL